MELRKVGGVVLAGMFFMGAVDAQEVTTKAARGKQSVKAGNLAKKYNKNKWMAVRYPLKLDAAKVVQEMPMRVSDAVQNTATDKKLVANESMLRLVQQADALVKSGKVAEAYALLEPREEDYSGDVAFDYLLGVSALDSGKPDRATIAFERVLAVNPNFSGARLDLARAYFAMGSDDVAKKEFETVFAQSPPEPVVAVIKKYLEAIDERRKAKIQQVTAYLETNMGHDDNITAATPDFTGGVLGAFGAPNFLPSGSSLHYAGMYAGVSGGVDFTRLVSEEQGVSLFAGADVKQRVYNKVNAMNNSNLDLRAGVSIVNAADNYRLTASFGQYWQSGFVAGTNSNRNTGGLGAEWKHSFGARDQMTWSLNFSQPRNLMAPTQDTNQVALSTSWLHIFEGKSSPLIFANINRSVDKALQTLASGTDMSRTGSGALVHFQITPIENTDFFLSGGLTVRHDDRPYARSQFPSTVVYARDETMSMSIGVTTRPRPKWTIKGAVAFTDNRSNLSLYQYRRTDSSISLRRDF